MGRGGAGGVRGFLDTFLQSQARGSGERWTIRLGLSQDAACASVKRTFTCIVNS